MPFLTLGALELKATTFERGPDETGGGAVRTLSGRLRGGPLWTARTWRGEVYCDSDAEAEAVHAAASHHAAVAVAGDALGGAAVQARVTVAGDRYARDGEGWYRLLSLEIREAL